MVLIGLAIGALFLAAQPEVGTSLFETVWRSTFGSPLGITQLIQLSTPLILAGVAVAVALRAGLWNIGVEGQILMGAWTATAVAFYWPWTWRPGLILLMLLAGFVGGAIWALVPAIARTYFDVSEIVTTLMLNFVATSWVIYWASGPWSAQHLQGSGAITSRAFPTEAELPTFDVGSVTVGSGFVFAVVLAAVMWFVFRYTVGGLRVDLVGLDSRTTWFAGIDPRRVGLLAFLASGGIGGTAGVVVALDQTHSLSVSLSNNAGYIGVVVAVLAAGSFIVAIPCGLLLALLSSAGVALQLSGVTTSSVLLLTGLVLLFAGCSDFLARYRVEFGRGRDRSAISDRGLDPSTTPDQ